MSLGLTRTQTRLLSFIRAYMADNYGVPPSYDEMQIALGLKSKSGIVRLIDGLEERGRIRRMRNRARSVELVEQPSAEYQRGYAKGRQDERDATREIIAQAGHLAVANRATPSETRARLPARSCPPVDPAPGSGRAFSSTARNAP